MGKRIGDGGFGMEGRGVWVGNEGKGVRVGDGG